MPISVQQPRPSSEGRLEWASSCPPDDGLLVCCRLFLASCSRSSLSLPWSSVVCISVIVPDERGLRAHELIFRHLAHVHGAADISYSKENYYSDR